MITHETKRTLRAGSGFTRLSGFTAALVIAGVGVRSTSSVPDDARLVTIPAGTVMVGTLTNTISTRDSEVGDAVRMRTSEPVRLDEDVRLNTTMVLKGEITESEGGGRVTGRAKLAVRFERLTVDGREYRIETEPFRVVGRSETKNSAKKAIGGAVVGGVVGAIAGSTKKGLLVGAVLGSGVAVATKGGHITLVDGQQIKVRLTEPVVVDVRSEIAFAPPF